MTEPTIRSIVATELGDLNEWMNMLALQYSPARCVPLSKKVLGVHVGTSHGRMRVKFEVRIFNPFLAIIT